MSRFLGRSKHCAPVAPDKPVDPVRPLRPVSPVAPVRPDDPVRPLRPVCPELPARQPSTCEADCCALQKSMLHREQKFMSHLCMSRFLRRSKLMLGPDKPVKRKAPVRTCGALRPLACQDGSCEAAEKLLCAPVAPDKPVDPVRPLRPVSPVAPVRPDDPVRPLRPVCPELPARQPSTCETECCHCRRVCCIESKSLCPIYACQDS